MTTVEFLGFTLEEIEIRICPVLLSQNTGSQSQQTNQIHVCEYVDRYRYIHRENLGREQAEFGFILKVI